MHVSIFVTHNSNKSDDLPQFADRLFGSVLESDGYRCIITERLIDIGCLDLIQVINMAYALKI